MAGRLKIWNNTDNEWQYTGVSASLFEIDVDGGLMPVTAIQSDVCYELDANDDIMPKEA